MALYVTFTAKDSGEPIPLNALDNMICEHLGASPDPKRYHEMWFDVIGYRLATGKTYGETEASIIEDFVDFPWYRDTMLKIVRFLEENFEADTSTRRLVAAAVSDA